MYRAFNTAVTGLQANQTRMEVIGNNIANVNTTAYKANRTTFEEQFAQTLTGATEPNGARGGRNAMQVGLGTRVASIDTIHSQGAIQATGKNSDIAIQGNGFLMLRDQAGNRLYSRDGNLGLDGDGNLVTNTGLKVQGYLADARGVVNENGRVQDLVIEANRTSPPQASTRVDLAGNLYRPARLTASEAYAHAVQNGVDAGVTMTGNGTGAGLLGLGNTSTGQLDAGELTINNVSIIGEVPVVPGDTTQSAMQKLADLINFHRDKTGVLATVKTTSASGNAEVEISLTQLRRPDQQIIVGGTDVNNVTLNGTQVLTPAPPPFKPSLRTPPARPTTVPSAWSAVILSSTASILALWLPPPPAIPRNKMPRPLSV